MNRVVLMGRLTRDPNVSYSPSQNGDQMAIARFTVAVDRRMRRDANNGDQQTADFISCVAFGRQGEFVEKYFKQGNRICLEGRIQTGSYTNKEGVRVYTTDVIAENVEFCESKGTSAPAGSFNGGNMGFAGQQSSGRPTPEAAVDGFMNIADGVEDEGLPFN